MNERYAVIPFTAVFSSQATNLSFDLYSFSCGHLLSPVFSTDEFYKTTKADILLRDGEGTMRTAPRTAATQPLLISVSSLGSQRMPPPLPQTTPELEVTGERGWLLGRAVSMETEAPVGSRRWQVCWVWSHPSWWAADDPHRHGLPLPWSGSAHAHP